MRRWIGGRCSRIYLFTQKCFPYSSNEDNFEIYFSNSIFQSELWVLSHVFCRQIIVLTLVVKSSNSTYSKLNLPQLAITCSSFCVPMSVNDTLFNLLSKSWKIIIFLYISHIYLLNNLSGLLLSVTWSELFLSCFLLLSYFKSSFFLSLCTKDIEKWSQSPSSYSTTLSLNCNQSDISESKM